MQKVVKFLEAYVQWVALGLAVLWIAWIGYAYWIAEPVTAPVAGQPRAPGDVDDAVKAEGGPIAKLDQALKNEVRIPPTVLAMLNPEKRPEYVADFQREMGLAEYMPALAQNFSPVGVLAKVGPETPTTAPDQKATLPVLAEGTVTPAGITTGMSVAFRPDPKVKINPNDPTQKVIQLNQDNVPNAQPLSVAATAQEVAWLIFEAKVDLSKLADAFTAANVPQTNANTQFLRVELVRQEQQPDGAWGEEKVIDSLKNVQMLAFPPKAGQDEAIYVDWASRHTADIAQPVFYELLRGDSWRLASMPDQDAVAAAQQDAAFDPAQVKPGEISKLTPEQLKVWRDWKAQKDKEEQDRRKSEAEGRRAQQAPRSGGEGRGGGSSPRGGGGGRYSPFDFTQRIIPNASGPRYPTRGPAGYGRRAPRGPNGEVTNPRLPFPGESMRPAQQPNNPNFTPSEPLPQGPFNPLQVQAQAPLEIWAHDETTQPGHKYRYKMRVYFQNPLWGMVNTAKNPADEQALMISTETPWSDPIMAPSKEAFFVQNSGQGLGGEPKINVEYIFWEDGEWKSKTLTLHPGDQIGKTTWTLVDVRPNGAAGDYKAVVVNDASGTIEDRYYKKDLASAEYKRLKKLVPAPAANPLTPGTPGAVGFSGGGG